MATATLKPKKKRLNKDELKDAETTLRKKYKHVIPGTLKNLAAVGNWSGKRTVKIKCATPRCGNERKVATSDLAQVRYCERCTLRRRRQRRHHAQLRAK